MNEDNNTIVLELTKKIEKKLDAWSELVKKLGENNDVKQPTRETPREPTETIKSNRPEGE